MLIDLSKSERSEALQNAQKLALERAVAGEPLPSALAPLVQVAAQCLGDASTVFVADQHENRLRLITYSNVQQEWASLVDGFPIAEGNPSCGTVAHTGLRAITDDVTKDPFWSDYVPVAQRNGIAACWSFPVRLDSTRVLGTFAVLHRHPRKAAADEIAAAEILANTAALIIQRELAVVEQRRSEELQRLLVNELSHRVKNTLAIVQSIASQTFNSTPDIERKHRFESRLRALSAAHGLLMEQNWQSIEARSLVEATLKPFQSETEGRTRIHIAGEPALLTPKVALALGMALHELASNALKYGALSCGAGSVSLTWRKGHVAKHLSLRWEERDGPEVQQPRTKGFGSRLLERGLPHDLGCDVELAFAPAGVTCEIYLPLREEAHSPSVAHSLSLETIS